MITVDYTKSFEELITAGRFDGVDITAQHFPIKGIGRVDVELCCVHMGRSATREDVLKQMGELGFRPATLIELLAFCAQNPYEGMECPIIALGSTRVSAEGGREYPTLDRVGDWWFIVLRQENHEFGWCENYRFLAAHD